VSGWRLAHGGLIDRSRPVFFTFDGRRLAGFSGDTVASALLANGVDVVARSIKLGRPRGIVAAGTEEPNALIAVEPGLALRRATEVELVDGLAVRSVSGRAPAPAIDETPSEHVWHHADVVVVGAGAAGLTAAQDAVAAGGRVVLLEGGHAAGPLPDGLVDAADFVFLPRTVAVGRFDSNMIVAHERRRGTPGANTAARDRLWHIRARDVVLATGAVERPLVFADNDRPGIMLAGSVGVYLQRYGVAAGRRAVVFTANDSAYVVARDLQAAGVDVVAIVDTRVRPGPTADAGGIEVLSGHVVAGTTGDEGLASVLIVPRDGDADRASPTVVEADLLAVSGGWDPALRLLAHTGARLRYQPSAGTYGVTEVPPRVRITGLAADVNGGVGAFSTLDPVWLVPAPDGSLDRHFVDLQRDATAADIRRAVDAGMRSPEHVKRFTTIGTGNDQGRTSGTNELGVLAALLGTTLEQLGPTTFRTPLVPIPMRVLGGPYRGELFDPVRTTPIHGSHVAAGALFENVGQWKRAWAYPREGESFDDAVLRECRAVREGVGIMDVSTLGKIDVQGPDAGAFVDRVYTNRFSTLKVGSSRYGLMLRADGMVFDDGTATRLADDHFHLTTTTGGAAAVLDWLEEWLQTEWPDLRVRLTSVTDEWAGVAIAGPKSRELLARLAPNLDVSAEAFPFMTVRNEYLSELPARIFRISFSGELSYEVYVKSWYGRALWDAIAAAGADLDVTPYGTEAMHVLRAEKGYVIVGQETDGTVTAADLGLDWMLSKRKWFIGLGALDRPHLTRPDRRQLVGLLPDDPDLHVPEGSALLPSGGLGTAGNVTSSYRSAALGRTFALGLLAGGRARIGSRVDAQVAGWRVPLDIVEPVLWDPQNERRDG